MVLKEKGKFMKSNSGTGILIIRKNLIEDSAFPFKENEPVDIKIDAKGKRLIVESTKKK